MNRRTRIKVCCIASVEEAFAAVAAGVDAIGLVSAMPSGPGPIDEAKIASIAAVVPPGVASFLLSCVPNADALIAQHARCGTSVIQIVDEFADREYDTVRRSLNGTKLVQVIHVRGEESLGQAIVAAAKPDGLLLDSGNPASHIKELGGTGRVHDWEISRRIVEKVDVPVYLAGGLNATNVGQAIRRVRPFGVDVCTGVRSGGKLDLPKLHAFVNAVQSADREAA